MTNWVLTILVLSSFAPVKGWIAGTPLCTKDSTTGILTSQFNIIKYNTESLDDIFGCRVNAANNGLLDRVECAANRTAGTYNGLAVEFITIESKVNLNNATDVTNGCGITEVFVGGQRTFQSIIGLRQTAGFIKKDDANYRYSCVEQSATNLFVTTNLEIITDNLTQDLTATMPELTLSVLKLNAINVFEPTITCNLGEPLRLRVTMTIPGPYVDYIKPWGLALFDTRFGPTQASVTSTANSYPITGSNGCPVTNGLDFTVPFTRQTATSTNLVSIYETGGGVCRRLGNTNVLWFSTYTSFCVGEYGVSQRCINFCASNGRKKRQDESDVEQVMVKLTIEDGQKVEVERERESMLPLLIGLTVGVFVLLVAVVTIALCVVCGRRRRRPTKQPFNNLTPTASTISIPAKV